jgi:hypothetical protein
MATPISYRAVLQNRVPQEQRGSTRALVQSHRLPFPALLSALIRALNSSPDPTPPTINATTEGAGAGTTLVVTGSGFLPILPNRIVTVRVVDDVFHERNFQQSSTPDGQLKMRIPLPCNSGLPFHVSATDSRPGPGILGVVFSNTVTLPCP